MGYHGVTATIQYIYGVVLDLDEYLHFLILYDKNPDLLAIRDTINKYISFKQELKNIKENDELTNNDNDNDNYECEEEYHNKGNSNSYDKINALEDIIFKTLGYPYYTPDDIEYIINDEEIYVGKMSHDSYYDGDVVLGILLNFNEKDVCIYDSPLEMFGDYKTYDMSFLSQFTKKTPKLVVTRDECLCCT
jgi:hypothetical protein